ncbi:MAG: DUF2264 domain-containing protein, partial [Planctomycetota bacterium]
PEVARIIQRRHGELMAHYHRMFGRNGHSLMWGRSIIYRCAASAPFAAAFLLEDTPADAGWSRRLASGNLLQFLTRDDVFVDGVPSLGFYRTFDPLVQSYSCAASPFWLAKIFLALHLPADSPFWTASESDGEWTELGKQTRQTVVSGPGLTIRTHGKTSTVELSPGKVASKKSNPNYTRLTYNSHFSWECDSDQGATAMAYCAQQLGYDLPFMANGGPKFVGVDGDVLYRQVDLPGWMARVDLAEIPLPGGLLRIDRLSLPYAHELHLAHYGIPHLSRRGPSVDEISPGGTDGVQVVGDLRKIAIVAIAGWDGVDSMEHNDLNPEASVSTVAYCKRRREKDYSKMALVVTAMLHGTGKEEWRSEQLNPVAELEQIPWTETGHPCGARVKLHDGREYVIDYGHAMGKIEQ